MKIKLYPILISILFISIFSYFVYAAGIDTINLISPQNNSWTNGTNDTIVFTFNYTGDNLTTHCSLRINGVVVDINYTIESFDNNTNINILSNDNINEGSFYWEMNCTNQTDTLTSNNYTLNVDRTDPSVGLNTPADNINTTLTEINFNWTTTDNFAKYIVCNLTIDGVINQTNIVIQNATATNISISGFNDGTHTWNVSCTDNASNSNTSSTRTVMVDSTAPSITNIVNKSISSSGAVINWTTDELANSTVLYGTNGTNLTNASNSSTFVIGHSITLSSLSASTVYFFNVTSCDNTGNCNTSSQYNFTTSSIETITTTTTTPSSSGGGIDRKSTRLNSSHTDISRMPSSA